MSLEISTKVGRIYANALYEIGKAQNITGEIYENLKQVTALYESNVEFRRFFTSPKIPRPQKTAAVKQMFEGKIHEIVLNLLLVLVKKSRESALDNIMAAFAQHRDEAEDRVHAYVRSAAPLTASAREKLLAVLKTHANEIELHEKVDESLIGGMIIKVHDFVVDNTVRRHLRHLTRQLTPRGAFSQLD